MCQEEVYYDSLARVLAWALYLEVPVVSFYHNENGEYHATAARRSFEPDVCRFAVSGISPEELFFAFRDLYGSRLLTKINWGLEFDDDIKFASKKRINGKSVRPFILFYVFTNTEQPGDTTIPRLGFSSFRIGLDGIWPGMISLDSD